ncbi:MAG TPA: response regulator transcription factor, partial [Planctomycetaceae bacterium]
LGAGYLLKTEPLGAVIAAVRQAAAGDPPYSAAVAERLRFDFESRRYELKDGVPLTRLTPRQVEMLRLIAGGYSTREIAEAVGMTEKGAESQKYRLMEKVGVRNRVELIRYAIREGLLTA